MVRGAHGSRVGQSPDRLGVTVSRNRAEGENVTIIDLSGLASTLNTDATVRFSARAAGASRVLPADVETTIVKGADPGAVELAATGEGWFWQAMISAGPSGGSFGASRWFTVPESADPMPFEALKDVPRASTSWPEQLQALLAALAADSARKSTEDALRQALTELQALIDTPNSTINAAPAAYVNTVARAARRTIVQTLRVYE
jgi:hypothetical protein